MNKIVVLDTGPLGMVTNPRASPEIDRCNLWLQDLLANNIRVIIPEIADYEIRRELLRAGKRKGLARLDDLKGIIDYAPITTRAMLKAAELWAETRNRHRPTADDKALDGDVILAAQAILVADQEKQVVVATTNVGHLEWFIKAREWKDIHFSE